MQCTTETLKLTGILDLQLPRSARMLDSYHWPGMQSACSQCGQQGIVNILPCSKEVMILVVFQQCKTVQCNLNIYIMIVLYISAVQ